MRRPSGGGGCGGCIGCLLLIIIFILAPGLFLLGGIVSAVVIDQYGVHIAVGLGLIMFISIMVKAAQANQYLCERCGSRFRL